MKGYSKSVVHMFFVVLVLMMVFISGCANSGLFGSSEKEETSATQPKSRKTTAVYYDFEDVLIPMELKVVNERTVVITTPGFVSGIITLKGRVDRRSLFNFFNNNMRKDNWNVVSQIKSPGTTIMVFQKTSRTSVITIRDESIYTYVEIGVAPTFAGEENLPASNFSESTLSE
jgi:hypothetical protein